MAPINHTGLSLSGISSTVPTPIRTGPIRLGGLDLCDLYISMGVRQIETFISHTWAQTPTGKLLEITMDDFALEMGLASPWQHNRLETGLQYTTTPSWIRHMFQFSMANKIRIHREVQFFGKQRENDRLIMESATDWTRDVSCLKSINNVRMYLKVVWLSDITTADGRTIDRRSLSRQPKFPVRNAYRWPLKHTTTRQDWRRWKQWIRTLCLNEEYNLIQPLGQWQVSQEDWVQYWDCFLHTSGELLYMKMPHETFWRRHVAKPNRRRHHHRQFYKEYLQCQILPETGQFLLRATATHFATYVELTAQANLLFQEILQEEQRPTWSNIRATKHSVITAITNTLNPVYLETSDSLDMLFRDFTQGTIIAVSDRSHQPTMNGAAAAWIVESECRSQWILGTINTPGPSTPFSACRSELIGLTAISVTLKVLASCLQQPRHVIIGCDGKCALYSLLLNHEDITANTKNADLLAINADIWTSVQMSPYLLVHVKGHQDTSGKVLSRIEKMNVLMDRVAFLTALYTPNQGHALHIPSVGMARITYNGRLIEGQLAKTLYDGIVSDRIKSYYDQKLFDGKRASLNQVCLAAFHYARNHAKMGLNIFVSKWLSDALATVIVLQKRKHRIFNRCPRCNHWGEDKWHIVVCWDVRAKVIWDEKLKELQHFITSENTKPDIAELIMTGLTHYRNRPNREPPDEQENWRQEQVGIGWDKFIYGFVSNELVIHQAEHYRTIGSRKSGNTWAGKLILQVWNLIHNLWLGRNEVLHQKDTINSISGETLLDIEIEREYDAGCENLPTVIHPSYRHTKQQLLAQSTEYKKGWLLMVKESLEIAEYSIFTSSHALRRWIGMHPDHH